MTHAHETVFGVAGDHWPAVVAAAIAPLIAWWVMAIVRRAARRGSARAARLVRGYDQAPLSERLVALLVAVAGAAHLALVPWHAAESQGLAWLFLLNGLGFVAAAAMVLSMRRWRCPVGALLVATVMAYIVAIGSRAEHADDAGVSVTLLELIALGLMLMPPQSSVSRWRRRLRWGVMGGGLLLLTMLTGGVTWASSLQPHAPGRARPTIGQSEAATRLIGATAASLARYQDQRVAIADGYRGFPLGGDTVHFENKRYKDDGHVLDPERPEQLVYLTTPRGPLLVGAGYVMPRAGANGPEPGGPLTHWHSHDICFSPVPPFIVGLLSTLGGCPPLSVAMRGPQMLHVWLVENPGGPFADDLDKGVIKRLQQQGWDAPEAAGQ